MVSDEHLEQCLCLVPPPIVDEASVAHHFEVAETAHSQTMRAQDGLDFARRSVQAAHWRYTLFMSRNPRPVLLDKPSPLNVQLPRGLPAACEATGQQILVRDRPGYCSFRGFVLTACLSN